MEDAERADLCRQRPPHGQCHGLLSDSKKRLEKEGGVYGGDLSCQPPGRGQSCQGNSGQPKRLGISGRFRRADCPLLEVIHQRRVPRRGGNMAGGAGERWTGWDLNAILRRFETDLTPVAGTAPRRFVTARGCWRGNRCRDGLFSPPGFGMPKRRLARPASKFFFALCAQSKRRSDLPRCCRIRRWTAHGEHFIEEAHNAGAFGIRPEGFGQRLQRRR